MPAENELCDVVNEKNEVIGKATHEEINAKGLMHRTTHALLYNETGFLLQKRAAHLYNSPSHWDITIAEHVNVGESYESAVYRGLKEELAIENVTLRELFTWRKCTHPLEKGTHVTVPNLYVGYYKGDFTLDLEEVAEARFISRETIESMIASGEKFTKWFFMEWNQIKEENKWKEFEVNT